MPALGQYCATKFAVEGLSEALRREIEPLGIRVVVVEPSGFRTDWAGRSAHESQHQIDDYIATAGNVRINVREASGKQPGDPVRAVKAIINAVGSGKPQHHLLLGNDAFEGAMAKIHELQAEFEAGEAVARAADFPKSEAGAAV
jgi:NAD(P)-dependent dehydrogenase (short-subunit alcohol dehydrogenase family)